MPIYEYECEKCGERAEFLESMNATGKHACPSCGSGRTHRVLSTFAARVENPAPRGSTGGGSCPTGTCPFVGN